MTEREAFKAMQAVVLELCDQSISNHSKRNDPDSNLMVRVWIAQRNSCIVHLQGVKGIQPLPPAQAQEEFVDPYDDDDDPPAVRDAKEKCRAVLGRVGTQTDGLEPMGKFFAGVKCK